MLSDVTLTSDEPESLPSAQPAAADAPPLVAPPGPTADTASPATARLVRALHAVVDWIEGHSTLAVAVVVVGLALPYLFRGPTLLADDWVWIRNAQHAGMWAAGGARQVGRPGALLLYALTFGLIGAHPTVLYLVQIAAWVVAALALLALLREWLAPRIALLTVLVWIVVPSHASLEHWASTLQAWVALALFFVGTRFVLRAARDDRVSWLGLVLLASSIACYEAVTAIAIVAAIVPALVWRSERFRRHVLGLAVLALPVAWALSKRTVYPPGTSGGWRLSIRSALRTNFELGLAPQSHAAHLVSAVLLSAAVVGAALLVGARRGWRAPEMMIGAGLAVIVLGVIPFFSLYTTFYGMYDRTTVVSGVGTALCLVGLLRLAVEACRVVGRRAAPRTLFAAAAVLPVLAIAALAASSVPVRSQWDRNYHRLGARAATVAATLARHNHDGSRIEVKAPLVDDGPVKGLGDGWNATAAVQVVSGQRSTVVWVMRGCRASGPPSNNPTATYGTGKTSRLDQGCVARQKARRALHQHKWQSRLAPAVPSEALATGQASHRRHTTTGG